MSAYAVIKNVRLQANGREYLKDQIITASEAGERNIARYLEHGYVKQLNMINAEVPPVMVNPAGNRSKEPGGIDEYLSEEETGKMSKKQLLAYAQKIGATVPDSSISLDELRHTIDRFIERTTNCPESEGVPVC